MSSFLWPSVLYVISWNASRCMTRFQGLVVDDECYDDSDVDAHDVCVDDDDV